jgi:hypothetical protein
MALVIWCRHDEYRQQLIEHLVDVKLKHWDKEIRILASKSLGKLVHAPKAAEFIGGDMLKSLVSIVCDRLAMLIVDQVAGATSDDLCERHGCLLGAAEVNV